MIVVDTDVLAYLLIPGRYTAAARAALARDAEWAAPLLRRSEFRNVLALYLRRRHLTLGEAVALQEAAGALLLHLVSLHRRGRRGAEAVRRKSGPLHGGGLPWHRDGAPRDAERVFG